MREEIRKPGAELNDAELENVSGAKYNDTATLAESYEMYKYAEEVCGANCWRDASARCEGGGISDLQDYMLEHGKIQSYTQCPYYRKA